MGTQVDFVKGHGTENDFVLVPDPQGALADVLDGPAVRRLTDRYAGVGADGVIRVVRTEHAPEVAYLAAEAEWFMDYRNADGSVAEMCGNGVRVLARYLFDHGLAGADATVLTVATRSGPRTVRAEPDGQYTVGMGRAVSMVGPSPDPSAPAATVSMRGRTWPAVPVAVPNPHAVVFLDDDDGSDAGTSGGDTSRDGGRGGLLDELGVLAVPTLAPDGTFPDGANVELVARCGERHLELRVWERGVGETRSCGTGVCAAAWAAMRRDGVAGAVYTVDVPGGRLRVHEQADGELWLTGPAVLGVSGVVQVL